MSKQITIIKITPETADKYLKEFYADSSLTFEGVYLREAHLYRDFFKKVTEVDETKPAYVISGKLMNDYYGLTGTNAYPKDTNILVFKLNTFKDVMKIAIPRFQIGGRWFDDIVENNASREGK